MNIIEAILFGVGLLYFVFGFLTHCRFRELEKEALEILAESTERLNEIKKHKRRVDQILEEYERMKKHLTN